MLSQLLCSVSALITISVRYNHASDIYETYLVDPFDNSPFDFNEHIQHSTEFDMDRFNDDHDPFDHSSYTQILPNESSFVTTPITVTSRGIKRDFMSIENTSDTDETVSKSVKNGRSRKRIKHLRKELEDSMKIMIDGSTKLTGAQERRLIHLLGKFTTIGGFKDCDPEELVIDFLAKQKWPSLKQIIMSKRVMSPKRLRTVIGEPGTEEWDEWFGHKSVRDRDTQVTKIPFRHSHTSSSSSSTEPHHTSGSIVDKNDEWPRLPEMKGMELNQHLSALKQEITLLFGSSEWRSLIKKKCDSTTPSLTVQRCMMTTTDESYNPGYQPISGEELRNSMRDFFSQPMIPTSSYESVKNRRVLSRMIRNRLFFSPELIAMNPQQLATVLGAPVSEISKEKGPSIPTASICEFIGEPDSIQWKQFFGELNDEYHLRNEQQYMIQARFDLLMELNQRWNSNKRHKQSVSDRTAYLSNHFFCSFV